MTTQPTGPVKVAVLGGGAGAVTAAFDLTDPRHAGRYEVTVYQMGWRLGGKGASGRGGPHARIEEHGLHIWFGFYENAFRCMRACYDELGRGPEVPIRTVDDAFTPAGLFGVTEQRLDRWTSWVDWFPMATGEPGTLVPGARAAPTVGHYVVQLLRLAQTLVDSYIGGDTGSVRVKAAAAPSGPAAAEPSGVSVRVTHTRDLAGVVAAAREAVTGLGKVFDGIELAGLVAAAELASAIEAGLERWGSSGRAVSGYLDSFLDGLQDRMAEVVEEDEVGARLLELVDLVATIVRGLVADGVIGHADGFDALDHYDLRDWLYLHGGRSISVDGGLIRGIYDLVFAYRDGDAAQPAFSAGQALRGMFRMFFDYQGAFAYHMQAGMGDVVFAPYYEVLRRRGVRFEFFHRVDALHPSADGTHIESIDVRRQARVDGGTYQPLFDVHHLPCWPSEPLWDQLPDWRDVDPADRPDFESPWNQPAPVEERTLRAGVDFDEVVFGLSLGSVPNTCGELMAQRTEWAAMVEHVGTVATQALQLWLGRSTVELGGMPGTPVIAGFVEPLDTWADMSHLIPRERWGSECRSIHYFCSAMPFGEPPPPGDSDVQQRALEQAWRSSRSFVDSSVGHFLPGAVHHYPSEFRWELLVDPEGRVDRARLRSQFVRANIAESERYVLSLPGTDHHRLAPGSSGYHNLALAGDWTDTGFNAGCVEAATMSGLMASAAVQRIDDLSAIHGHDHP